MKNRWNSLSQRHKLLFLLGLIFLGRFYFSAMIPLIDDEAYHWTWTNPLQLSYFDHPGMVAWLKALSTYFLGETYIAVRLPFFLFYVGTSFFLFKLAEDLFDKEVATHCLGLFLISPLFGLAGYVASPEPPFIFFWVTACWVFWQGYREDEKQWSQKKTWLMLGLLMGLGLNSKFIIALLAFGFGIYLLLSPRRKDLLGPWPWTGFFLATLIALPIFIWNIQNGWPGFIYQFSDRHSRDVVSIERWLQFLASQFALFTPTIYALSLVTLVYALRRIKFNHWRFILATSLPSFFIFFPQPLKAEFKPHWSGSALLILSIGVCYLWLRGWKWKGKKILTPKNRYFMGATLAFLIPLNFIFYSAMAYPWLPKAYRFFNPQGQWNTSWDFTNEFYGWEEVGNYVLRRQRELHAQTGQKPFLSSHRYETTAQLTWGTKSRVYMLSNTVSQFTVNQSELEINSLKDLNSLFVSSEKYPTNPSQWAQWDHCTKEDFKTYRFGEHARTFAIYFCTNFQGLQKKKDKKAIDTTSLID